MTKRAIINKLTCKLDKADAAAYFLNGRLENKGRAIIVFNFFDDLIKNSKSLEKKYKKIINDNFWDLL